jgi:hypothetical protein
MQGKGVQMGGYGSGRQGGWPTIEQTQSIKLSIHNVMRGYDGSTPIGKKWAWSGDVPGELTAIVRPQGSHPPLVELRYRFEHFSRDTGDQTQYVDTGFSPCRFGGRRWWWACPSTHRYVTKLYLPNGAVRFLSRKAYRLDYQSRRETWLDRAHRRSGKLHRKLGWQYDGPIDFFPDKPKGMHWRTYNAICNQIEAAEQSIDSGFMMRAAKLLANYGNA